MHFENKNEIMINGMIPNLVDKNRPILKIIMARKRKTSLAVLKFSKNELVESKRHEK